MEDGLVTSMFYGDCILYVQIICKLMSYVHVNYFPYDIGQQWLHVP